ncbi:2-phospho-L-lactate guanylyltransferase [Methanosphaera sp.]
MNKLITIIPVSSFNNSKTRLSPFLTEDERKQLLQSMLKDIVEGIKEEVSEIIIISKDPEVLSYAKTLEISTLLEEKHERDHLNNAIIDAIKYVKENYEDAKILILPSDIPLIEKKNIDYLENNNNDFIISPSKGGGTNLLYINNQYDYKPLFGEFSFFKHVTEAKNKKMNINIYDSFYVSIDINTPQDLGELLLHGTHTNTYNYLSSLNIVVENKHGQERLNVYRKDE